MNINNIISSYYNDNLTIQEKLDLLNKIEDEIKKERNSIKFNTIYCPKCNQYYRKDSFKYKKIKCKKLIFSEEICIGEIPPIEEDFITKIICPCGHCIDY